MGVFSRFMDIVSSNINGLLDMAEDPEKMIKLMLQEMEDTLIELKSTCATRIADKTRAERLRNEQDALASRWENRARLAVEKDRDDLAREALAEKLRAEKSREAFAAEILRHESLIGESKTDIGKLEEKLASTRATYKKLREEKAKKTREEQNAHYSYKNEAKDHFSRFSRMEEQLDRMKADQDVYGDEDLDARFADLEELDEIEAELRKIRAHAKKK
ncbi:PspA/IM30 family protein [Parasphaerochaeta coccoides]|uniref:Phage shock protein A, PspA n=1 Tax=Parasphaerochaeta coccoides (strain ATCC BAA-1237 / DSM 17374 / SPN1) TaxID=760011 RepID=F4GJV3_PARC1|nr:PspA/IM30 family protein [Parasphaerochaeta coccoides]AEC01378.1 phage shock protein A, PspA [Parasphaerochaeta coccoides DSM 17374]